MPMGWFTRLCVSGSVCLLMCVLLQSIVLAQSDIPEVLTPSLETPAEPSLYVPTTTEVPSVTPMTVNATNTTVPLAQQSSISLERLISGIPLLMVALLAPILAVIGVLFYTLFKVEQEGELSPGGEDSELPPAHSIRRSLQTRHWRKRHIKR